MGTETRLRVFEHQKLRVSSNPEEPGLTTAQWESLVRYVDKAPLPYYRPIHRGIQFAQYVGVIRVGKLTIEILPKVGQHGNADLWQQVLLDMLRESRMLDIRTVSQATLSVRPRSILDLYLTSFLSEVEQLLSQGLAKSYRQTDQNRTALSGKLLFPQHFTHNSVHQERFFVRHQTYDTQTLPNQLLYKTLHLIRSLTNHPPLITRARTLLLNFPELQDVPVSEDTFARLIYNRKTERYRPALEIARMLLLHYHPDLTQGSNHVLALLFDMNQVWEKFIWQRLRKSTATKLFEIHNQSSQSFWGSKTIRPDIFLKRRGGTEQSAMWANYIIDAKWKVNPTLSPADDDLKQMYVYNHHFQSSRSILVYPSVGMTSTDVTHPFHLPGSAGIHSCQLCALQVVDEQGLSKRITSELTTLINQS